MKSFVYIDKDFADCFAKMSLRSADDFFNFDCGEKLTKKNLRSFRQRIMFETAEPKTCLFLKRYINPPKLKQIKNWLEHKKIISLGQSDIQTAETLQAAGINTPRTIAYGVQRKIFEQRSFSITQKVPNSKSLEEKLPENKNKLLKNLAEFIRNFHATGFRHRDLYLCHIFFDGSDKFTLIDLSRVFKPLLLKKRFLIKDLTQLYYSAPADKITKTDRLRFYLRYVNKNKLGLQDKRIIAKIKAKAGRMAGHDRKHNRVIPFENL